MPAFHAKSLTENEAKPEVDGDCAIGISTRVDEKYNPRRHARQRHRDKSDDDDLVNAGEEINFRQRLTDHKEKCKRGQKTRHRIRRSG
eukprot:m.1550561 g.1550561  ORF g.1550561 m.1550561 type:complete len:88 (-) comp25265_c0_seq71:1493-1756(-)